MKNNKQPYEPPLCEVIALETIGMMAMSGLGDDSYDSEFGATKQRRGEWGDLWTE